MTKEQIRKAIFGKLRTLQRQLNGKGISCVYARSTLSHDNGEVGFKITCEVADSDNPAVLPKISLRIGNSVEEFDCTQFEKGLARLDEVFSAEGSEVID